MAFTWNYGDGDEIITTSVISELSSAITSLENHIRISVTNPSASSGSEIPSSLFSSIRDAVDTLDDYNYCRTYDSGQLIGVLSGQNTSYDGSDRNGRDISDCVTQYSNHNVTVKTNHDGSYDGSDDSSDNGSYNSLDNSWDDGSNNPHDNSNNAGCQSR